MRPLDEARASAALWLELAAEDLEAARVLAQQTQLPRGVCFHAQQAAEKALKACLAWVSDEDIPRIHDLVKLADEFRSRGGAEPPREELELLNTYAVEVRYPEAEAPTEADAARAVALAETIVRFAEVAIADSPAEGGDVE